LRGITTSHPYGIFVVLGDEVPVVGDEPSIAIATTGIPLLILQALSLSWTKPGLKENRR